MMKTLVISMLALMLVITVVFTSFGIAYSKTDFVGLVVDVERRTGEFSQFCIDEYKTISAGVKDILTRLKPMFDVLGDVANALLDFFNSRVVNWIVEISSYIGAFFKFVSTYGINVFDASVRSAFKLWYANLGSFLMSDGSVNYDTLKDFVNHFVFGEQNQFTYIHTEWEKNASLARSSRVRCNTTVIIGTDDLVTLQNSKFYFFCPSLSVPDDFAVGIDSQLRAKLFWGDSYVLPCGGSNLVMKYHGDLYSPAYIRISFDSDLGLCLDDVVYNFELGFVVDGSIDFVRLYDRALNTTSGLDTVMLVSSNHSDLGFFESLKYKGAGIKFSYLIYGTFYPESPAVIDY